MKTQKDYDAVQKQLESFPDVFADIINVLAYGGRRVVKAENLRQSATESLYKGASGRLCRQFEDIAKFDTPDGTANALYLLANQTGIDGKMLLRKKGYEGGAYREQYDGKLQDICPVMEFVLYWGQRRWNGPKSIRGLFRAEKLDPQAWDYIDDGRLHMFEMRYLPDRVRKCFKSDMRFVVEYLADEKSIAGMTQEVDHPVALLDMLGELSGDERFEELARELLEKGETDKTKEGGKWRMCKLIDEYIERGEKQGIRKGIQQGIQQGIQVLIEKCKDLGVSYEETAESVRKGFGLPNGQVQESMKLYW